MGYEKSSEVENAPSFGKRPDAGRVLAEEVRAQRHLRAMFPLREVDEPASERRVSFFIISEQTGYIFQH